MFFILSKILSFLIAPITWVLMLLILAFYAKAERLRRKFMVAAILVFLIFSNAFILDEVMRLWEIPAKKQTELKGNYEAGIVLGGMSSFDEDYDRVQFFRGVDRLLQAVDLYKKGIIKKIIFTGGSGFILKPEMKEGALIKRYILMLGVPEEDLIIESESRNTRENALFTKPLLKQFKQQEFLLITSGFHMRRSIGCFEKAGIKTIPYSTDRYSGPRKFEFDHMVIPEASVLYNWTTLIHEIIGFITYKIMGYS